MQESYRRKRPLHTVLTIAIAVVSALIMIIVLYALRGMSPQMSHSQQSAATADSLIKGLQSTPPSAVSSLTEQPASAGQFGITVKLADESFPVVTPVKGVVAYAAKDTKTTVDAAAVLQQAATYFKAQGMTESASSATSASYATTNTACQVTVQTQAPATVTYGCADTAATKDEYQKINLLLTTYKQSNQAQAIDTATITGAQRTEQDKGDVSGALLMVTEKATTNGPTGRVLLFGALKGQWQFVADLSSGKSIGKTNVPDESVAAIKDPKWNGVLATLVGLGE
ncbi:MAG TPA: hypothetical protein VN081_06415 [Dongiaceae bacterium]|nr:hypothetical protein [Dongiaceae bacterium]